MVEEGVAGATGEVGEVVAVGVGFAFEGDVFVGFMLIPVLQEAEEPFQYIKNIEGHIEELALLGIVDALMIDHVAVNPTVVAGEIYAEEFKAIPLRHQSGFDYFRVITHKKSIIYE